MPEPTDKATLFAATAERLQAPGLRLAAQDQTRPWGGFFLIDESQDQAFANAYIEIVCRPMSSGIYRNWNSDGPSMPQVYEKLDFQEKSSQLGDFTAYSPQVVSIGLGTNDLNAGDSKNLCLPFDSARYVSSYLQFIKLVMSKYPQPRQALLSSPLTTGKNRLLLQRCLTAVQQPTPLTRLASP
jgi:hypothetical protein